MSTMAITLRRVACTRVTDTFFEGSTDEFGWRIVASGASGYDPAIREEIPMRGMEAVKAGSDHKLDRDLARLGPKLRKVELEFWDQDKFSKDDLLGRVEIVRDGKGKFSVTAGESTADLGEGRFRLTGGGGDYMVWLVLDED